MPPDDLLHLQGEGPVFPLDVDGRDLVLNSAPSGLQPGDQGLVPLEEMHHARGTRRLFMLPGLPQKSSTLLT